MNNNKINELKIDEYIWIIFIILSTLNIMGDESEKKYYITNDINEDKKAKEIFTFTVAVSFILYLYFAKRNYQTVKKLRKYNCDSSLHEIRLIGSIFIVIGVLLVLYFQINDNTANNPSTL